MKLKALIGTLTAVAITIAATASMAAPTLYGVSLNGYTSSNRGPSSLYTIDTTTGAGTLIGNIGYAVNSIAVDPTTGALYASTTSWDPNGFRGLLSIDPLTGTGTEIGAFGFSTSGRGLTFDSAGNLFGWTENGDDPIAINKATGTGTVIGPGTGTAAQVLAFDNSDNLTLVQGTAVYNINTTNGIATLLFGLSFDPGSGGADIDNATGLLWAARGRGRDFDSWIRVTDLANNTFFDIDTDVTYLNALTFGGTINVPAPGALALIGVGLLGLGSLRRKAE